MQDEELDKLLTDAASQHHPPYNNEDWDKMLLLLNTHLPQQKDRRKPLFFILLFLFLAAGITTAIIQPWKKGGPLALAPAKNSAAFDIATKEKTATNILPVQSEENNSATTPVNNNNQNNLLQTSTSANRITYVPNKVAVTNSNFNGNTAVTASTKKQAYNKKSKTAIKIKTAAIGFNNADINTPDAAKSIIDEAIKDKPAWNYTTIDTTKKAADEKNIIAYKNSLTNADSIVAATAKNNDTAAINITKLTTAEKKKKQQPFVNNFAITFSAGGDVSYISLSNAGKLKPFYGAGISYVLNNRLRLSSGIMVFQKTYTAKPGQYKLPYGSAYPHLQKIDADCKIYEIPLSLYYNFSKKNKHNWFAGTGLSSYLMKKEAYDYVSKSPATGQTYSWKKTVANKNNHFLSVLTISGGYQYAINKRFSFMAEPYLKIPLGGVGDGNVKLNSTGLLFTAAFKPFYK